MNKYRSMKPCVVCGKTPTRTISYKRLKDENWTTQHYCVNHDPVVGFEDDDEIDD